MMTEFMTSTDTTRWHEYSVYHVHSSASKIVICEQDAQHTPIFFVNPSLYKGKKNKPDIRLHAVQSSGLDSEVNVDGRKLSATEAKLSPIVATGHFRKTGRKIGLAYGNPSRPDALHWESMHQENFSGGRYSFTIPPAEAVAGTFHFASSLRADHSIDPAQKNDSQIWQPVPSKSSPTIMTTQQRHLHEPKSPSSPASLPSFSAASPAQEGRSLTWKRTHSADLLPGVSNLSRRISLSNRKLVDNQTGEILALFEGSALRGLRHLGTLRVRKDLVAGLADMELGISRKGDGANSERRRAGYGSAAEAQTMLIGIVLSWCVIEERVRRDS